MPLSGLTRFGLGGPAAILVESDREQPFLEALQAARAAGFPWLVLGGGSNLVVADRGWAGVVLRYRGVRVTMEGGAIRAESGADLQALVDFSIERGLAGLHTMTRIPGWVGGAIYGNAGAYGHSVMEFVSSVRLFDGRTVRSITNAACRFTYRESVFKRNKNWIILSAGFVLPPGDRAALAAKAEEIRAIRDAKYPPSMKCAGSIFKNCIVSELPAAVAARIPAAQIREGKVASGWFLEQAGMKGFRCGGIRVADYHANLVYNDGDGTAEQVRTVVAEARRRVREQFGFDLEEEVQYVGFEDGA